MKRRERSARHSGNYAFRHRRTSAPKDLRNALLDTLLHASPQFSFWVVDPSIRYLFYNETHRRMMVEFWNSEPRKGGLVLERVRDTAYRENARAVYRRALAGESFAMELTVSDPLENERAFSYVFTPILASPGGTVSALLVISLEITTVRLQEKALKEAEEDRDILIHELDHQVKNTIQSVISSLSREMEELPGAESSLRLRRGIRRLLTLSQLYDVTLGNERLAHASLSDQLRQVIAELAGGVGFSPGIVRSRLESITMPTNRILPICQLTGEILGAVLDHLLEERKPRILVTLERNQSHGTVGIVATHQEPHELRSSKFAGRLLEEAAAELDVSPGPPRTVCTLTFPL